MKIVQNGAIKKNIFFIACSIVLFFMLFFYVTFTKNFYGLNENDYAFNLIKKITCNYGKRQIFFSVIFWFWGYLLTSAISRSLPEYVKCALAVPIAISAWGGLSIFVIVVGVPYTCLSMCIICTVGTIVVIYLRRSYLHNIEIRHLLCATMIVFSLSMFICSGCIRFETGNDYFGCVMGYGQTIVASKGLVYENLANFVYAIGIYMALMASWATMMGFETIIVIHFLLIVSFAIMVYYAFALILDNANGHKCLRCVVGALVVCILPPILALEYWVLSNAWVMVYMFIIVVLLRQINDNEYELSIIISFLLSAMSLLRAEGCLMGCIVAILLSYNILSKRSYLIISLPMAILEIMWLIKRMVFGAHSTVRISESDMWITPIVLFAMIIGLAGVVIYGLIYDTAVLSYIRRNMPSFALSFLFFATLALAILDVDRFKNNTSCVIWNMLNNHWGFFLYAFLLLSCIITIVKKSIGFWELIIYGYGLIVFDICMGRAEYLRYGIGDSFDRMIMGIAPICCIYIMDSVVTLKKRMNSV